MARKLKYEITIYRLTDAGALSEPILRVERRLKVPPSRDVTAYGKPIKFRRQKGWAVIELKTGEIVIYRKSGAGKYPNLFERFWKPKDMEEK